MSGHGHVVPNANGLRARCGGPGICSVCSKELHAFKDAEIERLRAENAKLREAVTWRSIESAPKDGTHILARDVPLGIRTTNLTHPPMVVHWFEYIGDASLSGWYLSHGAGDGPAMRPTHWIPPQEAPR